MHYFCIKFATIFSGGGTVPTEDPTPNFSALYFKFLDSPLLKGIADQVFCIQDNSFDFIEVFFLQQMVVAKEGND